MARQRSWRKLTASEIAQLVKQGNFARDWQCVSVAQGFNADLIFGCRFNETVFIGKNVSLENVLSVRNYFIDDNAIVHNVGELVCAQAVCPKTFFLQIKLINEAGLRSMEVSPAMIPADVDYCQRLGRSPSVQKRIHRLNRHSCPETFHHLGYIGKKVVLKNVKTVDTVVAEDNAVMVDCTSLHTVWLHSSSQEPSCIGSGVILNQVIVGCGSQILDGSVLNLCMLSDHVCISDVARVSDSIVNDNSHISCCEIRNSYLSPFHEQHHNNSFLIAAHLGGQSNIAAGATIGSNHNGRVNDCEMSADRGFWAGLCTSVKFPSLFASFTLLAKGDFPNCLHIKFPFSLVSNNAFDDVLEIRPAYWWRYNAFALIRNEWKYELRDKRIRATQAIETRFLAPDTVDQIIDAMNLFRSCNAEAHPDLLEYNREDDFEKYVFAKPYLEYSSRPVHIIKPHDAYIAYYEMLLYYAVNQLLPFFCPNADEPGIIQLLTDDTRDKLFDPFVKSRFEDGNSWSVVGGQVMTVSDVTDTLYNCLYSNDINTWDEFHAIYAQIQSIYHDRNIFFALWIFNYLAKLDHCELTLDMMEHYYQKGIKVIENFYQRALTDRERDISTVEAVFCNGWDDEEYYDIVHKDVVFDYIKRKQQELTEITKKHVKF